MNLEEGVTTHFRFVTISILSVLAVVALLVSFGAGTMWLNGFGWDSD